MRTAGLLALCFLFAGSVVACGDGDSAGFPRKARGGADTEEGKESGGAPSGSSSPSGGAQASASCPTDVTAPKQLATDANATDIRVSGDAVYFQSGTTIVRVGKDGQGREEIYESPDLVRAFADGTSLLTIESPNPPNTSLKVTSERSSFELQTDLNAASIFAFAADATSFYLVGDGAEGDVLYRISKQRPNGLETLAEVPGVISSAQLSGSTLWYVLDQTRVFKMAAGGGEPSEVFAIGGGTCNLAIDPGHAYCATGGAIEARDLASGTSKTILDSQRSKVATPFGTALSATTGIVVLSAGSEGAVKTVVRSVSAAGEERVVACGRDAIGSIAADATSVAWAEGGKGVFLAPR